MFSNTPFRQRYKSILICLVIIFCSMLFISTIYDYLIPSNPSKCPFISWHGGNPSMFPGGSCYCGTDSYCLCTPSLAIDCIIEYKEQIILVWRRDPPKDIFAIPGGFVNIGESAESATIREVKEETNLTVTHLEQFRLYSDPKRDKRRHTASMVYRCIVDDIQYLHNGDDAKGVKVVDLKIILNLDFAFDHKDILKEYINYRQQLDSSKLT